MLFNYLKITLRNLLRNKTASFIKIASLSIGLISFAIISLFVFHELSYDRFHENPDQVYRVVKDFVNDDGSHIPDATTPPGLAPALQKDLPEVAFTTRLMPNWGRKFLLESRGEKIFEEKLLRIDSSFFNVFTFPFIRGSKETSLSTPNYIILSESAAKRYFGNDDPIGKPIKIDIGRNGTDFFVTGVVKDVPRNSHFTFDFLISVRTFQYNAQDTDWGWYNYYTYVRLKPGTNHNTFESKLQPLFKKYDPDGSNVPYSQALSDIHLNSHLKWELATNGDRSYVVILSTIALFIALLAAINYINLVTAQSAKRAKEVGIRKATGAGRGTLIRQFLLESMVMVITASIISLIIAEAVLPFLKNFLGTELSFVRDADRTLWLLLGGITVFIGLVAGVYPAFYLSSFQPVKVLKGIATSLSGGGFLRKGLVTFQFVISTVLIIGALIITNQLDFIRNTRLGFDQENIIIIQNVFGDVSNTLETEIKKIAGVTAAGGANGVLGGQNWTTSIRPKDAKEEMLLNFLTIDEGFLEVMNVKLKEGRNFSPKVQTDSSAIILNEAGVKQLGIKEPVIGTSIVWGTYDNGVISYAEIIGVIEDFHFTSFHEHIKPFGFVLNTQFNSNTLFVKTNGSNLSNTIDQIKKTWTAIMPARPFEYTFQDEHLAKLYVADSKFQQLFSSFTIIAILIACLGLFGLSIHTAEQRIKEIGIRKVLGANILDVVGLLSGDFLKLIIIAILIASPIGWFVMNRWLDNFAYKIELDWVVFVLAGGAAVVIALITVSFQSVKAAVSNPVDALKNE